MYKFDLSHQAKVVNVPHALQDSQASIIAKTVPGIAVYTTRISEGSRANIITYLISFELDFGNIGIIIVYSC